jgi:hypothetical protein
MDTKWPQLQNRPLGLRLNPLPCLGFGRPVINLNCPLWDNYSPELHLMDFDTQDR